MAGTPIFRLNAYIDRAGLGVDNANQTLFTTQYKFFKRLESAGYITELARNSGPGPGVNTGNQYWDEGLPFLEPAWVRWRWNASPLRPAPHYMLQQGGVGASTPNFSSGVGSPARSRTVTSPSSIGVGFAFAAHLDNLLAAVDPWGGIDATTKGSPVWKAVGVGEQQWLVPLANMPGGTYAANKEAMTGPSTSTTYATGMYVQMIADQDNLCILYSRDATPMRNMLLMGTYIPLDSIAAPFPLYFVDSDTQSTLFANDNVAYGSTTNNAVFEGGIWHDTGVSPLVTQTQLSFLTTAGIQPNAKKGGARYERYDMMVGIHPTGGTLGKADPDFTRLVGEALASGLLLDGGDAIAVGGTAGARARFPWSGGVVYQTGTARDGVDL